MSQLLSEIKIKGATYDYVRECLSGWKAGLVGRSEFVEEMQRLNEVNYTNRLAEFVRKRCRQGVARISLNTELPTGTLPIVESKRMKLFARGNARLSMGS